MKVAIEPGTYVVAVSGGVDSVVLLDMLAKQPGLKLIVAHYDHGIRDDSEEDRRFVQQLAMEYGLPFSYGEGRLGAGASEDAARRARYEFLRQVRDAANAEAVITAHHQDDLLETALINIMRGTGRKGLTSLRSRSGMQRPLLHMTKRQLKAYALAKRLEWREDSTNQDTAYLRNYIRRKVMPKFSVQQRRQLQAIVHSMAETNQSIDVALVNYLHMQPERFALDRKQFVHLPHNVAREVIASWLRHQGLRNFDTKALERLVIAAKTAKPGTFTDALLGYSLDIGKDTLLLRSR